MCLVRHHWKGVDDNCSGWSSIGSVHGVLERFVQKASNVGAITGQAYFCGVAGERFAVRNSGAIAVVEGVGDHGCEYMTGGLVIVLGDTGRNFAAGMSGGIAFVYNRDGKFSERCNHSMVTIGTVPTTAEQEAENEPELWHMQQSDEELLHDYIQRHINYTGSPWAKEILDNWSIHRSKFVKVFPKEYQRAMKEQSSVQAKSVKEVHSPTALAMPVTKGIENVPHR